MDSFRLWQIAQSDLPGFLRQLHERLEPHRADRPLAFWHKTLKGPHVSDQRLPSATTSGSSTVSRAKRIALGELSLTEKISMLQKIGGLADLSAFSLNALASNSNFKRIKPDEILFKEGDAILEIVFLFEGQCLLTKKLKNGSGSISIACLGNGELCTESIVSGTDLSACHIIQSLRHEHTAIITAPSIVITVDREHFRTSVKYETIKHLKAHVDLKRMVRGQIGNRLGVDQRFLSKLCRPITTNQQSEQDLTPLTARLPDIYRTSAFAFLSHRRCTEHIVVKGPRINERDFSQAPREPVSMKKQLKYAKIDYNEAFVHQVIPNKLVEKWVSAPEDLEDTDSTTKEFRLMKSRGVFFHI